MFWTYYLIIGLIVAVFVLVIGLILLLNPKTRENLLWNLDIQTLTKGIVFCIIMSILYGLIWPISLIYFLLCWIFHWKF